MGMLLFKIRQHLGKWKPESCSTPISAAACNSALGVFMKLRMGFFICHTAPFSASAGTHTLPRRDSSRRSCDSQPTSVQEQNVNG